MPRVSVTEVSEILPAGVSTTGIDAAISAATALVDNRLAGASISAELKREIERYLAAHFTAIRVSDARIATERTGDASATYEGNSGGSGLSSTSYGQQALELDVTGALATLSKRKASALIGGGPGT